MKQWQELLYFQPFFLDCNRLERNYWFQFYIFNFSSLWTKDYEQTKIAIEQTISFKFLMASIAAVLIAVLLKPLMLLFSEADVVQHGLDYGYIRLFFLPIMFSSYSINTVFRCIGDSKIPMSIMILVSFLNVILDAVFMFETIPFTNLKGLNLGVFGAGLATVVSQTISFLLDS